MTTTQYKQDEQPVDSAAQKNVRTSIGKCNTYEEASLAAAGATNIPGCSKVKIVKRADGTFDVAYFESLEVKKETKKVSTTKPKKVKKKA